MPMGEASRRRKEARFKTWYLQGFTLEPSPFPAPWDAPVPIYGDKREIRGFLRQDQSSEVLIAAGQGIDTRGRFAVHPSANLSHGDVLRSEELGVFIRIEGDPLETLGQSTVQVKTFMAVVTSRSVEEQAALKFAGYIE